MLAARSEEVQSMYATAEKAQSEAEQMRSEYTERLSKAKEEAAEIVGSATRRAAERSDEILRESSQQASAMVKKAERVIEQERIKAHKEPRMRLRICPDDRLQDRGARCKAGGSRTLYRRLY
ncbi:MAG: ATP synthase F0 subunit B [Butyricicoccus sp.]